MVEAFLKSVRLKIQNLGDCNYRIWAIRNKKSFLLKLKKRCAFEIKLGANQIDAAAKNLLDINQKIKDENGKPASVLCVICGMSNAAYKCPDGVYVVPITALKN